MAAKKPPNPTRIAPPKDFAFTKEGEAVRKILPNPVRPPILFEPVGRCNRNHAIWARQITIFDFPEGSNNVR
jgi:hypothetical protein